MARRNWIKCACGAKLNVKRGERVCFPCKVKGRKE